MTDIEARVRKIIVEYLGVDEARVVSSANFVDDFGADSLDLVELVIAAEDEFQISIPDEEAEKLLTVSDAVLLVTTKTAASAAA